MQKGITVSIAALLVLSSFLPLFAIVPTLGTAAAATSSSATYAASCPYTGGNLQIALPTDPSSLNPVTASDVNIGIVSSLVLQGLISLNSTYGPQPQLAKSWSVSPNGLTVTFNLQPNVYWQDGVKFTSADVVYSLMDVDRLYASFAVGPLSNVVSASAPDNNTVILNLAKPEPYLISVLNAWYAPIIPKHLYYGTNTTGILQNPYNDMPVGTGPFMFQSWTHGSDIILVRNPNYWQPGLPCLNQVTFDIIPTFSNALTAYQSGNIDYIPWMELPPSDVSTAASVPGSTTHAGLDNVGLTAFWMNNRSPIFSNLLVRQAMAYALDGSFKQNVVQLAYAGQATTADNPFTPAIPQWYNTQANQSQLYPQNLTIAAQLLDKAGYPAQANGTRFSITMTTQTNIPAFADGSQLVKAQLAKIGVNVNIDAVDEATYEQIQFGNRTDINWDASYLQIGLSVDPAIGVVVQYLTSDIQNGLAYANIPNYSNSTVDNLLNEAIFNPNATARAQEFKQAQTVLVADSPAVWIAHAEFTGVYGNKFANLLPNVGISMLADYANAYWEGGTPNTSTGTTASSITTTASSTNTSSSTSSSTALNGYAILAAGAALVVITATVGFGSMRRRIRTI